MRPALLVLAVACSSDVTVKGRIFDGWAPYSHPLPDAVVTVLDGDDQPYDTEVADSLGRIRSLTAPRASQLTAVVEHAGFARTAIPGSSGNLDVLSVAAAVHDGDVPILYAVRGEVVDDLRARFAGCPGADDGSTGVVYGVVRAYIEDSQGQSPEVTTAEASLEEPDGTIRTACYLDPDTGRYDDQATVTGATGAYALFVPEGRYVLRAWYTVVDKPVEPIAYAAWVPSGGIAPRVPTWVQFAFEPGG